MIRGLWNSTLDWFERGDLVPFLIIVSAAHYIAVLSGKDFWFVAVAIGVLVDLGHYRWVRAAARYDGSKPGQLFVRWLFAALLTAISLGYHQRYYQDWLLSAPIPLLIASLAWLAKVDQRSAGRPAVSATQAPLPSELPKIIRQERALLPAAPLACPICGKQAKSQNALNAHMRAHPSEQRVEVLESEEVEAK